MPRGGRREGAGRPPKAKALLAQQEASGHVPELRPRFVTAKDFAVWALNAPDIEVDMDQKMRAMQALLALEGKQPAQAVKPDAAETAEVAMGGRYAPRKVRGFGVVDGDRS